MKNKKPTDQNLADFFGTTRQTISNYKSSVDIAIKRRYEAFLSLFNAEHNNEAVTIEEQNRDTLKKLSDRLGTIDNIISEALEAKLQELEKRGISLDISQGEKN